VGHRLAEGLAAGRTNMRRPVLALGYVPSFETVHALADFS
jgi:hypothetical protein